jgi:hypothetical protein
VNSDQTFGIVLVLVISIVFAFAKIMKGPIGEALARRLGGKVDEPDRDAEISELRTRLAELEERVDFTERVLLQQPERTQLPAGGNTP